MFHRIFHYNQPFWSTPIDGNPSYLSWSFFVSWKQATNQPPTEKPSIITSVALDSASALSSWEGSWGDHEKSHGNFMRMGIYDIWYMLHENLWLLSIYLPSLASYLSIHLSIYLTCLCCIIHFSPAWDKNRCHCWNMSTGGGGKKDSSPC